VLIILIVRIFLAKYLAVPDFLLTFANAKQDDSNLSGRATVSPMASSRRLFLCLIGKNIFPNWENIFS
jgi:hypothetical protein